MSNLWLNIRFWHWHLQWSYDDWLPSWARNEFFWGRGLKGLPKIQVHALKCPWR